MATLARLPDILHGIAWGPVTLALLVLTGLYFTLGTGTFQLRHMGLWLRAGLRPGNGDKNGGVSSFQALSIALAGTLGTGNIAGVATALVAGGPGALVWMVLSALVGMMTKYAEITLAVHFRRRDSSGQWIGGPMVTILRGLGPSARWLAVAYAVLGALAAFGIGNTAQVGAIADATENALSACGAMVPGGEAALLVRQGTGVLAAVLVGLILLGGVRRIARVTQVLVPAAAVVYIGLALAVVSRHGDRILPSLRLMLEEAFTLPALGGGALGAFIQRAGVGVARGVFTNEAGLGSASIAHAYAQVDHPARQGLQGIFEVFTDTVIMCTLTGLAILCSGVYGMGSDGAALTGDAFATALGPWALPALAVLLAVFAFAAVVAWSLYGQRCFEFLTGGRWAAVYRWAFVLAVIPGATLRLTTVWQLSDTLNGLMALPNLIALLALSGTVFGLTRDFLIRSKGGCAVAPKTARPEKKGSRR